MTLMILIISFFSLITMILVFTAKTISKKSFLDYSKMSPFECGFDPKTKSRLPLSLQFFLTAIIFLIFDVEITLLLPIPLTLNQNNPFFFFFLSASFILILLIGLYFEWNKGALNWMM